MYVVKVPGINGFGKTNGCEKAGNAILSALKQIRSNERNVPLDVGLLDLEEIHLDNSNLPDAGKLIYHNALEIFESKPKTIFLGGDHSISYNLVKGFLANCYNLGKEPCLFVFDAHPDCMTFSESEKTIIPNNREWLSAIINHGFPPNNIFLVGSRNSDPSEITFLKKKGVRVMNMNQILENIDDSADILLEFSHGKELYVSIDIDVIDPSFAPATSSIEPGGFTSRQFIYLINRFNKIKNLRAVDIVEINPEKSGSELTVMLGAKILSELI